MRSRTRLGTAPVRYFVDPCLEPAALGIGTEDLAGDPEALGFHYEALVIRDLRAYAQLLDARVDSWRDADGHEVDAMEEHRSFAGLAAQPTAGVAEQSSATVGELPVVRDRFSCRTIETDRTVGDDQRPIATLGQVKIVGHEQ